MSKTFRILALALTLLASTCALAQAPFKGTIKVKISTETPSEVSDGELKVSSLDVRLLLDNNTMLIDNFSMQNVDDGEVNEKLKDAKIIIDQGTGKGTIALNQDGTKLGVVVNVPYLFNAIAANDAVQTGLNKVINFPLEKDFSKVKKAMNIKTSKGADKVINGLNCKCITLSCSKFTINYYSTSSINLNFSKFAPAFGTMGTKIAGMQNMLINGVSKGLSADLANEMKGSVPVLIEFKSDDMNGVEREVKRALGKPIDGISENVDPGKLVCEFTYTPMATVDPSVYDLSDYSTVNMNNDMVDQQIIGMLPAAVPAEESIDYSGEKDSAEDVTPASRSKKKSVGSKKAVTKPTPSKKPAKR